jgi:large subunit ribosomal protein L21
MYAVIETGGKQYRVEVGTELEIERLEAGPGESVAFDRVLLIADGDTASIGRPVLGNASVAGEVVRRDRGDKVVSFKYRPKARRRVKKGHRQELTVVRISDIVLDGRSAAAEVTKAEEARKTERQRLEEGARRQAAKDAELAAKLAADQQAKPKPPAKASTSTTKADTTEVVDEAKSPARKAAASKAAAPKGTARASSASKTKTAPATKTEPKPDTKSDEE